jgi:hypothetical protein
MPLTLVVETGAGLANANAFASRVTVGERLEASPYAEAWAGVDAAKQDQCIAEATRWLSSLSWDGVPTTRTQALAFPRAWMYRPDGYAIASNLIAPWLIDATARLAFWLSQQENPYVSNGLQPGTELQLPGGLRLTPGSSSQLPIDVRQLIRPYLSGGGSSLVRA